MSEVNQFIKLEALSAKILLSATVLALLLSNSPLYTYYYDIFHTNWIMEWRGSIINSNLIFWINEGLMTLFFLVVGLEIKYELVQGTLNSWRKGALPAIGAMGGMIVPALLYISINHNNDMMLKGWAVPTATDIAFSLAVLSLLKSRIHSALKVFLTALAIFDDLAAIAIIALFYTAHLVLGYMIGAFICVSLLFFLNKRGVASLFPYSFVGVVLWYFFLKSGVHATLAGVLLALMIPLENRKKYQESPAYKLKHGLHTVVNVLILPLFAFANSGVSFLNLTTQDLHITIILGVSLGLFVGKQIGIFTSTWLAVKLRIATLPDHMRWSQLYAVSVLGGIGFTISLFIGTLAFTDHKTYLDSMKLGVLVGSILSGCIGYMLARCVVCKYEQNRALT